MVVLTAFTSGLAILQMGRIDSAIEDVSTNWLPSLNHVGEMQTLLNDMRRAELQHVVTLSADEKKLEFDRINADIVKLSDAGHKFEALLDSPTERQAFDTYKQELTTYLATSSKLVALSSVGPTGLEATVQYLRGDSRVAFRAIFKTLNDLIIINSKNRRDPKGGFALNRAMRLDTGKKDRSREGG